MTSRLKNAGRIALAALILTSTVALVSWKKQDGGHQQKQTRYIDTIPQQKERKVRDLDEALNQLDNLDIKAQIDQAMAGVAEAMKHIDAEKLHLEVQNALKNVDMEKIKADVDKAMKEIDFDKLQAEIKASMDAVDWKELKAELANAKTEIEKTKKIDLEEMNRELAKAMEEIKNIKPELEKELAKAKEELKNIQPQIEKELAQAKVEIEKAKAEIREYKTFVDGLEKEGLLNKNENYSIRHKDGKLTVNGKEVSSTIYNKYKSFLDKHKTLHIEKDGDSFDMDDDNDD